VRDFAIPPLDSTDVSHASSAVKHLPGWFPMNGAVGRAKEARKYAYDFRTYPYVDVQKKMVGLVSWEKSDLAHRIFP
jgi:hypothetical protein